MTKHYSFKEKQELRTTYIQFAHLEKLMNEWDPIGLIGSGAPEDEYDCLTAKILMSLLHDRSEQEIVHEIVLEMQHHFNWLIQEEYVAEFVKKIFSIKDELFD